MPRASQRVPIPAPLAIYVDGFAAELRALGYAISTIQAALQLMAHLSRWLVRVGLEPKDLTPGQVNAFLRARHPTGQIRRGSPRLLARLLDHLQRVDVAPVPEPTVLPGLLEPLIAAYHRYLLQERGLATSTLTRYERAAQAFLSWWDNGNELGTVTASDVTRFVLDRCRRQHAGTAKNLLSELRSLLRFLYLEGHIAAPLASGVPALPGWRDRSLPRAIDRQQLAKLLDSCPRNTPAGCRDYAILILLARLGLRASEVSAIELADLDWRHGSILIRGKGNRYERLPLPTDVGEAVSAYLVGGRHPCVQSRRLFLTVIAPLGGITKFTITDLVHRACDRADIPRIAPHRFRHTAATEMLRGGAPLAEIGQLLRHRSPLATARYAKVDYAALRTLARRWPGGEE
jgi:integrase/recombinase XerD